MGIFGFFLVAGVLAFAGILPGFSSKNDSEETFLGKVVIWGTLPKLSMADLVGEFNQLNKTIVTISYVEKSKGTFDQELIEALAEGKGPDVIFLPQDLILRHRNKLFPIPYTTIPERSFKDTYIEEGELYLGPLGVYGVPLIVDPLVMFWNRDIFSSALVSSPPVYWDEFFSLAKTITKIDAAQNIKQSLVSFGEYDNVANAKGILSMLIMQAGNPIIVEEKGVLRSSLTDVFNQNTPPTDEAFRFYTEFSNPTKTSYSWNRSLPYSRDMFAMGNLALYLGHASEYETLKKKNPHLNFDVTLVPQARDAGRKLTFGNMQSLAILKSSKNNSASIAAIQILSGKETASSISSTLGLPPARRDLLAKKPPESHLSTFFNSAVISKGWLDPSPSETNEIFDGIVRDITSERRNIGVAVGNGNALMTQLLKTFNK